MPRNPSKRHCTVPGCNACEVHLQMGAIRDSGPPRRWPHPRLKPRLLEAREYARFVGLAFQGAAAISRLLRATHAIGGNQASEFEKAMEAALDAFSAQQGVEL